MGMARGFVLVGALVLAAASGTPGERASSCNQITGYCPDGGATCPAGETCSSDMPSGLTFTGPSRADFLFDDGVKPVAVGGLETLRVDTSLPFDAEILGDALGIVSIAPPDVQIDGVADGSAYLRILKPGTEELYDRLDIPAATVADVRIGPQIAAKLADLDLTDWSVLVGHPAPLTVQLLDGAGDRLVDERMTFAGQTSWDGVAFTAGAAGTSALTVTLGDGSAHDVSVDVVDAIDDVRWARALFGPPPDTSPLPLGAISILCFRAVRNGRAVLVTPTFTIVGDATIAVDQFPSCVDVTPSGANATLFVMTGNIQRSFALTFAKTNDAPLAPWPSLPPSKGERRLLSRTGR